MSAYPEWLGTDRLTVDVEGKLGVRVYLRDDQGEDHYDRTEDLGPIESADVPPDLAGELAWLLDVWRDAPSRREVLRDLWGDYWASRGPC